MDISSKVPWKCPMCNIMVAPICIYNINLFVRCSLARKTDLPSKLAFSEFRPFVDPNGSWFSLFRTNELHSSNPVNVIVSLMTLIYFVLFLYGAVIPVKCVTFHTHNLPKIMSNLIINSKTNVQYDVFPRKSVQNYLSQ